MLVLDAYRPYTKDNVHQLSVYDCVFPRRGVIGGEVIGVMDCRRRPLDTAGQRWTPARRAKRRNALLFCSWRRFNGAVRANRALRGIEHACRITINPFLPTQSSIIRTVTKGFDARLANIFSFFTSGHSAGAQH